MRLTKFLTLALLAAALAVPAASAGPGHGTGKEHGRPPASGPGCKPAVSVNLTGTLTSLPSSPTSSFTMKVEQANEHGQAYLKAGTATLNVDGKTKVRRRGHGSPAELTLGERVHVQAKACLADLANGATPALTARKIEAGPGKSKAAKPNEQSDKN